MKRLLFLLLLSICAFMLPACNKDSLSIFDCERLKQGLETNDIVLVSGALDNLLIEYSEENMQKLVNTISDNCNMTATVFCFDCIYTSPAQSEIEISYTHENNTVRSVLDISQNQKHKMVLLNLH